MTTGSGGDRHPAAAPYDPDAVRVSHSPGMAEWLLTHRVSLAYTSYQSGRLIVVGVAPDGRLFFNEQNYVRAMGLHYGCGQLHVASLYQIWRLTSMLRPGEFASKAFDAVFVPRSSHVTGYVDAHELAVDRAGRLVFVNSRYSCLAIVDPDYSFRPIWKPNFISALAPEDRCHLNGLALLNGSPRYVTAISASDSPGGWRERRDTGGLLIDVANDSVITDRLSMPHSPRAHDGAVWVLDSGRGYLVRVDPLTGERTDITFAPGFLRGMAIHNGHAVIGISMPRGSSGGLPLQSELSRRGISPSCAVLVVKLETGAVVEFIRYESEVIELFDIAVLPDIRNPMTIGPATEELLTSIRFNPDLGTLGPAP